MSLSQRVSPDRSSAGSTGQGGVPGSPVASRAGVTRWADPRLWVGVLLVLGSVVLGARLLAAADDTVAIWQLERDMVAGSAVTSADLRVTRVHFDEPADSARYVDASSRLPADATLTRDIAAGEMLTVSSVTTASTVPPQILPLAVTAAGMPSELAPGDSVDVWATPTDDGGGGRARPVQVLQDATVTAVGAAAAVGIGGDRQVAVALPHDADVGSALRSLHEATVVLVQNGS